MLRNLLTVAFSILLVACGDEVGNVASWALTELGGGEFGGCCINATLRDYARIGRC